MSYRDAKALTIIPQGEQKASEGGVFYPIVPYPAPRMVRSDRWRKRPCVLKYRAFRDEVRLRGVVIPSGQFKVTFFMAIPRSYSQAKRDAMDGQPHTSNRADADNLLKALLDAALKSDGHIWSPHPEKRWTSGQPGILIEPLEGEGR